MNLTGIRIIVLNLPEIILSIINPPYANGAPDSCVALGRRLLRVWRLLLRVCGGPCLGRGWCHAVIARQPPQPPMPLLSGRIQPLILERQAIVVRSGTAGAFCFFSVGLPRAWRLLLRVCGGRASLALGIMLSLLASHRSCPCFSSLTATSRSCYRTRPGLSDGGTSQHNSCSCVLGVKNALYASHCGHPLLFFSFSSP